MIDRRKLLFSAAALGLLPWRSWARPAHRKPVRTTATTTTTTTLTPIEPPIPLVPPTIPQIVPVDVRLWPADPPGDGGPWGALHTDSHGAVANVVVPMLTIYRPVQPNGTVVIIAAGGGYERIEIGPEATPAALWLAGRGITACVLRYRLPGENWHAGVFAPFQDAQRAVRLVRGTDVALGPGNRPVRIGVLGFSAGGHLMGMAAAQSGVALYPPQDEHDGGSARPDFAVLIYPVITLQPPFDHTATRRALIGAHPNAGDAAGWSVETHVGPDFPPVFLANAADDTVAPPENAAIMADACKRAGVPVERMLFATGGHGFGLGRPDTPTIAWPEHFAAWLGRGMVDVDATAKRQPVVPPATRR